MLAGGCFCGAVRYQAAAEPFHETVCHCADCRRAVGAAAVAWFTVPSSTLRWTAGTPAAFQSSPGVMRRFCAVCGTSLTYEGAPGEVDVTICSLDDPNVVPPRDHTRTAARLSWDIIGDGLPTHPQGRPASEGA
ncbi:MAG: GFA family protein [Janthinobacterium lividum]